MTKIRMLCRGTGGAIYWLEDKNPNNEWYTVEFDNVEEATEFLRNNGASWKQKFHQATVVTLHKSFMAEEKKTITIWEREE